MQPMGGIARIYNEILPRMCTQDTSVSFSFYVSPPYRQQGLQHERIQILPLVNRSWRPTRVWRRLGPAINRAIYERSLGPNDLWHATYFALPPSKRKAYIVSFYDALYHRFPQVFHRPGEERLRQQMEASLN